MRPLESLIVKHGYLLRSWWSSSAATKTNLSTQANAVHAMRLGEASPLKTQPA